jgi:hypothetical protein
VDTSTHHLSAFGHHVTIGTGFPIYEGGEEGLLPSVNILRFHRSTLASTIQTTFSKVSTDLIPAAPLWLRDRSGCQFKSLNGNAGTNVHDNCFLVPILAQPRVQAKVPIDFFAG